MTWSGGDGVEGGRAGQKRTCVYLWLVPADVWQKPTQHCEVTIPQLKVNKKEQKPTHSYSQQPDRFWQKEWGKGKIGEGD